MVTRRDAPKDGAASRAGGGGGGGGDAKKGKNDMIAELEKNSPYLTAVKADVETQAEFIHKLSAYVQEAAFVLIDDVVAFVAWLDGELSYLVDEQAVLKHFKETWPEEKTDALREASFKYQELLKLERQLLDYADDPKLPVADAFAKMSALFQKAEEIVYAVVRARDEVVQRFKKFDIPVDWVSDSGAIAKIKLSCVKLAKKFMERAVAEADRLKNDARREKMVDEVLVQAIRFAFRAHQFAGGLTADGAQAFQELRTRYLSRHGKQEG